MKILKIVWQSGKNFLPEKADPNYLNLESAILKIEKIARNYDIKIVLEKKNGNGEKGEILIDGEPFEKILNLDNSTIKKTNEICRFCKIKECKKDKIFNPEYPEYLIINAIFIKIREKMFLGA